MRALRRISLFMIIVTGLLFLGLIFWSIGQAYISRVAHLETIKQKQDQTTGAEVKLALPEMRFWTCQVGVFKNEENAKQERERLKLLSWDAEIFARDPWAVGIGLGQSAGDLLEIRQELAKQGIKSVPKEVVVPALSYKVEGNGAAETAELLRIVNSLLTGGISPDALNESLPTGVEEGPVELAGLRQAIARVNGNNLSASQVKTGLSIFAEYETTLRKLTRE